MIHERHKYNATLGIAMLLYCGGLAAPALAEPASAPVTLSDSATIPSNVEVEAPNPFMQALISAYTTNPRLKAAREELKQVDEGVATALSGFRPTAVASFSNGRERTKIGGIGPEEFADSRTRSGVISQPLFRGGQTIYGYQSAKQQVKAARASLNQVEQSVLFDAVNAYSDVFEKQSVLALSQNNVDVLARQLEASQARFDVGELTRTDVAQSEARYAQALADLQQADGDLKTAKATFERVIGYAPINLLPDSVIPELPGTLQDAISIAERHNPDIIATKHTKKASKYDVDQAIGVILPEISLDGSINRTRGSGFLNRFNNDALAVNVTVPLYQSGAEYSRVRAAKNRHQQFKYLEMDIRNNVVESVTRAFEDYRTSLSVINSTAAAVDAADIARAGVKEENQFGVRTVLDVLDAEQELFRTRVGLVQAERNKTLQAYQLLAAIGMLSTDDLGLPVARYNPEAHYDDVKWMPIGF